MKASTADSCSGVTLSVLLTRTTSANSTWAGFKGEKARWGCECEVAHERLRAFHPKFNHGYREGVGNDKVTPRGHIPWMFRHTQRIYTVTQLDEVFVLESPSLSLSQSFHRISLIDDERGSDSENISLNKFDLVHHQVRQRALLILVAIRIGLVPHKLQTR